MKGWEVPFAIVAWLVVFVLLALIFTGSSHPTTCERELRARAEVGR